MKHHLRTLAAGAVALGLLPATTSCSSTSDSTMTQIQGTTLGALGGAAVGAVAGLAIGGDTQSVVTGLAVGAAAGALAGFAWGTSVVKQKQAYASMEQYVSDNNRQLSNRITQTRQYNQKLQKQITSLKGDKSKLDQKSRANAQKGLTLINQDLATAQDAKKEASGADLIELNNKINELNKEKAVLTELASL